MLSSASVRSCIYLNASGSPFICVLLPCPTIKRPGSFKKSMEPCRLDPSLVSLCLSKTFLNGLLRIMEDSIALLVPVWKQPSHPSLLSVSRCSGRSSSAISLVLLPAEAFFTKITEAVPWPKKTFTTVQCRNAATALS